jgi:plastocyanin
VTVHLNELAFQEAKIMLSPGTRVTWVNDEGVGHFVNTETHPEHTYFTPQNSRELKQGESFTVSFDTPGQYNYHCSAHVPQGMLGSILVVP